MLLCLNHKKALLTCWDSDKIINKRNIKGNSICSLPNVRISDFLSKIKVLNNYTQGHPARATGKISPIPGEYRRLNKSDALQMINATGQFVHVGIGD